MGKCLRMRTTYFKIPMFHEYHSNSGNGIENLSFLAGGGGVCIIARSLRRLRILVRFLPRGEFSVGMVRDICAGTSELPRRSSEMGVRSRLPIQKRKP